MRYRVGIYQGCQDPESRADPRGGRRLPRGGALPFPAAGGESGSKVAYDVYSNGLAIIFLCELDSRKYRKEIDSFLRATVCPTKTARWLGI